MNARDQVKARMVGSAAWSEEADALLDGHRAEVLAEAEAKAREVVARLWGGGITQQQLDRTDGARAVELEIGLLAATVAPTQSLCDCGAPIPAKEKKPYCSDRCRWADDNHGPDDVDGSDES